MVFVEVDYRNSFLGNVWTTIKGWETMSIENEYLRIVKERFMNLKTLGDKTIAQLSEDDLHWAFNDESNSIAVIVKHVSGNMVSRWTDFLTTDGEKPDRNRDQEFTDDISSISQFINIWDKGWDVLFQTLDSLTDQDLLKKVYIRSEGHLVMEAIERQLAHYAYHVGQIVYVGKQVKNQEWKSLSISRGKSDEYLEKMKKRHG